jgi:capsular exopolysaccharide synthesis family protein
MDLLDYLRTFRRRWLVIVAAVIVAMTAAWFTTETIAPAAPAAPTFQASTLLVSSGVIYRGTTLTNQTLAVVATIPAVADRAADELGSVGDPARLLQQVQASPDVETSVLRLTAFAPTAQAAERIANAFAIALIDFLDEARTDELEEQIAFLDDRIRAARRAGSLDDVALYRSQLTAAEEEMTSQLGITVIQPALAEEVESTGFNPPDSPVVRLSIAAAIGLLAGAAIALLLERVDTKIRGSEQATERFGYPVLAEIPWMPRGHRKGVITADRPTSPGADAFRLMGAGINVALRPRDGNGEAPRGSIVLVTSAGPAEGKSTVVANLAAVLAEEGKKVIVFSADLRRATLHNVFQCEATPGLVQVAQDPETGIRESIQWTLLDHVLFVASGGATDRPGEVLASPRVAKLLEEACLASDWVLLDTAPILVAGESAPLIDRADLVLVVARAGTTSNPVAERTRDTLHRLGADATWVVLNASRERGVPSGYHRYHVSADRDIKARSKAQATKGFPR